MISQKVVRIDGPVLLHTDEEKKSALYHLIDGDVGLYDLKDRRFFAWIVCKDRAEFVIASLKPNPGKPLDRSLCLECIDRAGL